MLLYPPIDELVEKADGNPYKLAVMVGKEAKALDKDLSEQEKEKQTVVTRAVNEYYTGKIVEK